MALYQKWDVKNDFAYVLQFFSLISDGLGSVSELFFWSQFYIVILGMTFFSSDNLLFPISIWTVFPLFYLDFYSLFYMDFYFFFGLLFLFKTFISFLDFSFLFWTFISLFAQIEIWSWISSKFFFHIWLSNSTSIIRVCLLPHDTPWGMDSVEWQ